MDLDIAVYSRTAFSLNLYSEVFYPVMSKISKVTPTPFDTRPMADIHKPFAPTAGYAQVIETASQEAVQRKWAKPVGSVFYTSAFDVYGVSFYKPGDDHGWRRWSCVFVLRRRR
jgi:hypothetical protein